MNNFNNNYVIISAKYSEKIIKNITKLYPGINIIKTKKCLRTYKSIEYHPDISICKLNKRVLVVEPRHYNYYYEKLKCSNIELIKGYNKLDNYYPYTSHYNVAVINKHIIHNLKYTDKRILNYSNKNGYKLVNVNQGYTKCSVSIVDEKSIITSDKIIHREAIKNKIDSLLISPGYIRLPGEKYGFIGGATGKISKKEILFTGHLDFHPDKDKILDYLDRKEITPIFLSDDEIIDLGTIIFI